MGCHNKSPEQSQEATETEENSLWREAQICGGAPAPKSASIRHENKHQAE
jgi:hypothetical protein